MILKQILLSARLFFNIRALNSFAAKIIACGVKIFFRDTTSFFTGRLLCSLIRLLCLPPAAWSGCFSKHNGRRGSEGGITMREEDPGADLHSG